MSEIDGVLYRPARMQCSSGAVQDGSTGIQYAIREGAFNRAQILDRNTRILDGLRRAQDIARLIQDATLTPPRGVE